MSSSASAGYPKSWGALQTDNNEPLFTHVGYFLDEERPDIYRIGKVLSEYAYAEGIQNLVFIDQGARTMRVAMMAYWRLARPTLRRPDAYFFNPNIAAAPIRDEEVYDLPGPKERLAVDYGPAAASKLLVASQTRLLNHKDAPLMLVDACIHTGNTAFAARQTFEQQGFRDIRLGVYSDDHDPAASITSDICITQTATTCHPCGYDNCISNGYDSIYTHRVGGIVAWVNDDYVRRDIRRTVRAYFASDPEFQAA